MKKEYGVGPFRSQHAAPDWPNLLSRQIRIGNVSACSLCYETVVKKRQSEWFLFVPPPPTVPSMLSIHSSAFDTSGTPTSVNNKSRIFMFLFLSTRGICRDSYSGNLISASSGSSSSSFPIPTSSRSTSTGSMHPLPLLNVRRQKIIPERTDIRANSAGSDGDLFN